VNNNNSNRILSTPNHHHSSVMTLPSQLQTMISKFSRNLTMLHHN